MKKRGLMLLAVVCVVGLLLGCAETKREVRTVPAKPGPTVIVADSECGVEQDVKGGALRHEFCAQAGSPLRFQGHRRGPYGHQ